MKSFDEKIFFLLMGQMKNKEVAYVMKFIAVYSSSFFLVIYGILFIQLLITKDLIFIPYVIGPAMSLLSVMILRRFIKRKRPFETFDIKPFITHEKGASFPSKHGTSAFAIAIAMMWVHPLIGSIGLLLAVLTGLSRVMVGVHYPSDIIAGVFIAILVSQLTYILSFMPLLYL
ncbi:MAG: phosphatase PAP2 family protein [Firmicutes bacterium HGW-Firmicutes-5]|nr:MAG: phosphatase PAP2 family protein [Firmicutes bacterium HGW-Firmicutes-5]